MNMPAAGYMKACYWVLILFMQPANILHIRSLYAGWMDKDHVLLHACFQILSDFVEKEMRVQDFPDWNTDESSQNAKGEIEALYEWWLHRKDDRTMDAAKTFRENERIYEEDDNMLKRLIDVRRFLWT
jgi:hypothetical protein